MDDGDDEDVAEDDIEADDGEGLLDNAEYDARGEAYETRVDGMTATANASTFETRKFEAQTADSRVNGNST